LLLSVCLFCFVVGLRAVIYSYRVVVAFLLFCLDLYIYVYSVVRRWCLCCCCRCCCCCFSLLCLCMNLLLTSLALGAATRMRRPAIADSWTTVHNYSWWHHSVHRGHLSPSCDYSVPHPR